MDGGTARPDTQVGHWEGIRFEKSKTRGAMRFGNAS